MSSEVHPACALCRGGCCEVIPVPIDLGQMTNDSRRHLRMRGQMLNGVVFLNCSCSNLAEGRCGIYDTRPQVCREFEVGGADCRTAIKLRRPEQAASILQAMAP